MAGEQKTFPVAGEDNVLGTLKVTNGGKLDKAGVVCESGTYGGVEVTPELEQYLTNNMISVCMSEAQHSIPQPFLKSFDASITDGVLSGSFTCRNGSTYPITAEDNQKVPLNDFDSLLGFIDLTKSATYDACAMEMSPGGLPPATPTPPTPAVPRDPGAPRRTTRTVTT